MAKNFTWYFRLHSGEWGYVKAPSLVGAIKQVVIEHNAEPAHVEPA